jgi:hypothetical protein
VSLEEVAERSKWVRVAIEGEPDDLALVDVAFLANDHVGNLMPFETDKLRALVLSRAEPAAIGMSPIGGLLQPVGASDDGGLEVRCDSLNAPGRRLLAPISAGLYRPVNVTGVRKIALGEPVELVGPGVLAFDGDRERRLADGQRAYARVERAGPYVIRIERALALAAERQSFCDRDFRDAYDER